MGLDVTYKGQQIAQLTEDGSVTLNTAGKFCEGNIGLTYSGGGGGYDPLAGPLQRLEARWSYADFAEHQDFVVDAAGISWIRAGTESPPSLINAFLSARNLKTITIKNFNAIHRPPGVGNYESVDMRSFCERNSYIGGVSTITGRNYEDLLESVKIQTVNNLTLQPSVTSYAFADRRLLRVIECVFDMSQINAYDQGYNFRQMFANCSALEEVRFVPNTILWMNTKYQIFNVSQNLSDASLVSIANALAVGSAAPNIRLLSTPYARCATLMGTVADGLFIHDDQSGTVSLADFITNTKGWTLYT